jgi:ABC-type phosphate transport system permease subunit
LFGAVIAVLSSIFIVELAPVRLRRIAVPVIRLLASVPSVIYGLIGVLVLVPFVGHNLITTSEKESVQNVVQLSGSGLLVTVAILTVMITPIMIALICEALVFEPLRTLASSIIDYNEGISAPALRSTLYAFALLLLFSAFALSVGGYLVKLPLRKYQVRG